MQSPTTQLQICNLRFPNETHHVSTHLPLDTPFPHFLISHHRMWVWPIPEQDRVGNQIPTFRGCGRVSTIYHSVLLLLLLLDRFFNFPAEMVYDSITRIKMRDLFLFSPKTKQYVFLKCPHIILNVRSLSFLPKDKITCFSQVSPYTRSDKERINSVTYPFLENYFTCSWTFSTSLHPWLQNSNSEVKKHTLSLILHEFLLSQDNQTGGGVKKLLKMKTVMWLGSSSVIADDGISLK